MNIRKFLHKFGMHSIYWARMKGDENYRIIERRCQFCDWHDIKEETI